jgi:hypothetical protein
VHAKTFEESAGSMATRAIRSVFSRPSFCQLSPPSFDR